jgi:glutamine amidotransferase
VYHDIKPVWEDDLTQFAQTTVFIAHARSAFRDEGIAVENNMPFSDGESMFVFNGELNGVRIRENGRIGAEKIYNYIRRFDKGDKLAALQRATGIISKRTRYVRAMNIVLAQGADAWLATQYNEDPEYFQMHQANRGTMQLVCSEPFRGESDWSPIANGTVAAI